jgi:hypothetical protein
MYGAEVPAYHTLVEVSTEINDRVRRRLADADRLGSLHGSTAERHGAIRVGTPASWPTSRTCSPPSACTRPASTICARRLPGTGGVYRLPPDRSG